MAYALFRNKNQSLVMGTTEGKYYYKRPNTEDPEGRNTVETDADRRTLSMWNGFFMEETPQKDSPGR